MDEKERTREQKQLVTNRSATTVDRAMAVIPGGAQTGLRQQAYEAGPVAFEGASGAELRTVDGTHLVDYHLAFGPIILGHGDEQVDAAAKQAIDDGVLFGAGTSPIEIEVAEQIVELIPSAELVNFCNSGTEATYHAIRLARAATGGSTIVKFEGCYHGWHDYVSLNVYPPADRVGSRYIESAGVLETAADATIAVPFNDPIALRSAVEEHRDDLAGVIVEPIPHSVGCLLPSDDFLETLRAVTRENDVPLIFDEVITAFRHSINGVQAELGITPDITCMAKAMGNGYPVAAVAGRRDILNQADIRADEKVVISGTYSGHPVGLAAAAETLRLLDDEDITDRVSSMGDAYRSGMRDIIDDTDVRARVVGYRSIFSLQFGVEGEPRQYGDVVGLDGKLFAKYTKAMRDRGHFFTGNPFKRHHVSAAHTEDHLDRYLADMEAVLTTI